MTPLTSPLSHSGNPQKSYWWKGRGGIQGHGLMFVMIRGIGLKMGERLKGWKLLHGAINREGFHTHLDTIPETESDEVIKSNVEDLVPIPSESEGISNNMCDVPFCDNSHFDALKDHFEIFSDSNDDCTSSDDDYVEASPPNSELVSLEEVKDFYPEDGENDTDILLKIKDDILREKFDHTKETGSGSTTTHADNSLPEYDSFHFEIDPDQSELSRVVMETILGEQRIHVPNVLPTHPTLYQDSDFSPSDDSLGSDLVVSFPSGTRNKIFDPGISIEVQSERFLSLDDISNLFISDPLFPVIYVKLPFEDRHYLSFTYVIRIFLPYFTYLVESPFLLSSGSEDTIFDRDRWHINVQWKFALPHDCPDFEDFRARGFFHHSLDLLSLACFYMGI
ncbi:hypothetical protein Tco_0424852 [Tanacetum coccineum]